MFKFIVGRLLIFTFMVMTGCQNNEIQNEGELIENWQITLDSPSEEIIYEIASSIYNHLYRKRSVVYVKYNQWDTVYVHGYIQKDKNKIKSFVHNNFDQSIYINYDSSLFPSDFLNLSNCDIVECNLPDQCNRTIDWDKKYQYQVVENISNIVINRGIPVSGIYAFPHNDIYKIEISFFTDCEYVDEIMADIIALL